MWARVRRGIVPINLYLIYYLFKNEAKGITVKVVIGDGTIPLPITMPLIMLALLITTIMVSLLLDEIGLFFTKQSKEERFILSRGFTGVTALLIVSKICDSGFTNLEKEVSWDEWVQLLFGNMKLSPIIVDSSYYVIMMICISLMFLPTKDMLQKIGISISRWICIGKKENDDSEKAWDDFFIIYSILRAYYVFFVLEIIEKFRGGYFTFVICAILMYCLPKIQELNSLDEQLALFCKNVSFEWENRQEWIEDYSRKKEALKELQICREQYDTLQIRYNNSLALICSIVKDKELANNLRTISVSEIEKDITISKLIEKLLEEKNLNYYFNSNECNIHSYESIVVGMLNKIMILIEDTIADNTDLIINFNTDECSGKHSMELDYAVKHGSVKDVEDVIIAYENKYISENLTHENEKYYKAVLVVQIYADLIQSNFSISCDNSQTVRITFEFNNDNSSGTLSFKNNSLDCVIT